MRAKPSGARQLVAKTLGVQHIVPVLHVFHEDPIGSCMVAARVNSYGIEPKAIGGELWSRGQVYESLCFAGANFVPLRGTQDDLRAFADRACYGPRLCSSLVGRAELVLPQWELLESEWGPARDIRAEQPLLAKTISTPHIADPLVRRVKSEEIESYLAAAIDMFISEVGLDPRLGDGGRAYRRRVAALIAAGRAWARFDGENVVFKAEVGAMSQHVGQIQGVWVRPELRGQGLGSAGTAAVAESIIASGRVASLYVNGFNLAARRAYKKIGFTEVGTFATILLD
ncbi:MAG: GNAT family N-acetyltransferase [Mycobacteriaceae bacterium]